MIKEELVPRVEPWNGGRGTMHPDTNSDGILITVGPKNISSEGEEFRSDWFGKFHSIGGEPSFLFFVFAIKTRDRMEVGVDIMKFSFDKRVRFIVVCFILLDRQSIGVCKFSPNKSTCRIYCQVSRAKIWLYTDWFGVEIYWEGEWCSLQSWPSCW